MASDVPNGTHEPIGSNDIEMKDEATTDEGVPTNGLAVPQPSLQTSTSPIPPTDPAQMPAPLPNNPYQQQAPLAPAEPALQPLSRSPLPPVAPSAPTPPPASARPSSIPPSSLAPPEKPNPHGSPTRVYINQNVTPHLLEGMKYLAAYEPEKPLKWLSDFLARKSTEVEGA